MAITERDFVEIFARHGLSRDLAVRGYESYSRTLNESAHLGSGISDELAKKDIDLIAAALAAGALRNEAEPVRKRGFLSRLFGK
ncbi:MAG: hypothetical protein AABO57_16070 [Acidobacteriota bacterium]